MNTNAKAIDAFIRHKAKLDEAIAKIMGGSEDFFGIGPDEIHWGHVGSMECFAEAASAIADKITGMGDS